MDKNPVKIYGQHDEGTIAQLWRCMNIGKPVKGVLCADGHLGYAQPVGGVIAYENQISVSGVGFDIGCGNQAIKLDMKIEDVMPRLDGIVKKISSTISFGVGQQNARPPEHGLFDSDRWVTAQIREMKDMARAQLGTVGSGNHYVDLFRDEDGWVWIGVHFGSRGLGHRTATKYLKLAGGRDGMNVAPALLDVKSDLGEQYLAGMSLAGEYAYAGREWVCDTVRKIIGGKELDRVHNHHNYAWYENHWGKNLWVVRKGATPAFPGQRGFVGGSMGDDAVIIRGVECDEASDSLYSTIHGAGRLYSRSGAKKTFTRTQMNDWVKSKGIRVIGGDVDESPMAYRRLPEVLEAHKGTMVVEHRLSPFAVFMAGRGDFDPYRD